MGDRLKGKVAIVTGSGRGIGRAEAMALAAEGAKVVVNDLGAAADGSGASASPADEVCQEIKKLGGEAVPNFDSVATWAGGENIVKTAIDKFGRIDILVNNAGILRDKMVFNMTEEEWDIILKIHLYGHFYCTRAAAPYMRQQRWGRIINTSSIAGLGNMGQANYSAAKEGIVGFTRTVARDMGKYGVTCNALRPNAATRMTVTDELMAAWKKRFVDSGGTDEKVFKEMIDKMVLSSKPEHIAPVVVWLATEEAANVNGATFFISGNDIGIYAEPAVTQKITKAEGFWSVDELVKITPKELTNNWANPMPAQPAK
ncbi:MAG: SDR family NAD(P)-dependent oxidoreductase [Chloroflexi bacterium]|jgi:NAD(P)-dependent dehydrogenase (short-subunit alcohol dehydrogenase family)|nr:SDR family NAD(P)-dependent oxidoreductase [Chloroflexota bacterium]